jgi:hypothetical protein
MIGIKTGSKTTTEKVRVYIYEGGTEIPWEIFLKRSGNRMSVQINGKEIDETELEIIQTVFQKKEKILSEN